MSAARQRRRAGVPAIDLIEEAVTLLRRAPALAHLAYYFGAVPFWLGVLYFISDMSSDAYAASHLTDWSFGVALLYVWKKAWQTYSAAKLRAALSGLPDELWTAARTARMIAAQAAVQPWGLLVRPIASVITLPFAWVAAFYQNATVLGDGTPHEQSLTARAAAQSKLWVGQTHALLAVILVFTIFVWLNVTAALGATPFILKTGLGIETIYSRSGSAFFNTTFFTTTIAITSLCVDPLRKAIFVLRCFHGTARQSGEDLAAELRRFSRAAVAALLLVVAIAQPARAADAAPSKNADPAELDRRIGEVLERREYAWRAPRQREKAAEKEKSGWLGKWIDEAGKTVGNYLGSFFNQLGRLVRWIGRLFKPPTITTPTGPSIDWVGLSKAVLALVAAALVGVLGWLLFKSWTQRRKRTVAVAAAAPIVPDLRSEDVVADQLPEDGWLVLAREHAARGELALALRAAWLASLAHLGQREFIRIARHKSNRDYERELRRRARDRGPLLDAFDANLLSVERSWYGNHAVTADVYARFEQNHERIRES